MNFFFLSIKIKARKSFFPLFQIIRTMTENEEPQIFKKRYKIVKKLGAGNFGTAYLVTDLKTRNEP